jgi:hypothetical protein
MHGYSSASFEGQLKAMRDKEKKKPRKKSEAELFYKRKSTKKCNCGCSKRGAKKPKKK